VPSTSAGDAPPAVIRLHPIRSLVVAIDGVYCDRARSVLGDLGPVVCARAAAWECAEPAEVVALVREEHADVLLLDVTGCEAQAGQVLTAVADSVPRVGVVIVCEHSTAAARSLGALPKWGWTQDLRNAVERAHAERTLRITGALPAARRAAPRPAGPLAGWD
jgi:hypothetical protein